MTVGDLINGSLRLLGVLASGEEPTAEEANDCFTALNSMLESWNLERLMVYAITPQTFGLQAGKKTYTMGAGGDFNALWPTRIEKMTFQYASDGPTMNLPLEMIDLDQYQRLLLPDTQSPIPNRVYVDDSYPLRNLSFYLVPSVGDNVNIFTWDQISAFASLPQVITLPPGYERALRANLALEVAPEFGKEPSQVVASTALTAKAILKSFNLKTPLMRVDGALLARHHRSNIFTGQ